MKKYDPKETRQDVHGVFETDIENLFERMGKKQDLDSGNIHCKTCGKAISVENFGMVYKESGQVFFICDSISCIEPRN